jgi:hypothetical protein
LRPRHSDASRCMRYCAKVPRLGASLLLLAPACPLLEHLELTEEFDEDTVAVVGPSIERALVTECPRLSALIFSAHIYASDATDVTHITADEADGVVATLAAHCPSVCALHPPRSTTDAGMRALGGDGSAFAPTLAELDLRLCAAVTDAGVIAAVAGSADAASPAPLRIIAFPPGATDTSVVAVAWSQSRVRALDPTLEDITLPPRATDVALAAVAAQRRAVASAASTPARAPPTASPRRHSWQRFRPRMRRRPPGPSLSSARLSYLSCAATTATTRRGGTHLARVFLCTRRPGGSACSTCSPATTPALGTDERGGLARGCCNCHDNGSRDASARWAWY